MYEVNQDDVVGYRAFNNSRLRCSCVDGRIRCRRRHVFYRRDYRTNSLLERIFQQRVGDKSQLDEQLNRERAEVLSSAFVFIIQKKDAKGCLP